MASSGVQSWIRGSLIGAGAFGKVNLAVNRDNGQLFAVKSIECSSTAAAEMRALENEVQILESLASPYVVSCLGSDWSMEKGRRMRNVFLEYMPGGSIADLMQKLSGKLEEPLIRAYTRSILEGLNYLHSRGVVHCDIKGKNVLVGTSGLKLADFGSAKRLAAADAADGTTTTTGTTTRTMESIKGTPLWMAPEVARQVEQGTASDIWSLGCTVVEMATGKAPWSHLANPLVALYHIGCTDDVPPMPASLSPEGLDFLAKCFQRDAAVRPTAEQLLAHPFITGHYCQPPAAAPVPASPCSVLDSALLATWDSSSSETSTNTTSGNSTVMNSVPILALKQRPAAAASAWVLEPKEHEEEPQPQPQQQQQQQQAGCATTEDWWCTSPLSPKEGQWITVRSPKPAAAVAAAAAVPWPAPAVLGERVKLGLNFAQLLQAAASSSSEEKVEEEVVVLDEVEEELHKDEAEEVAAAATAAANAKASPAPAAAEEQELAPAAASDAADSCAHDATAATTSASASAAAEEKCAAAAAAYAEDSLVDDYPSSSSASSCPAPSECTRADGDEDHGCSTSSGEPSRHTSRGTDCAAASASGSQMEEEEEEEDEGGPGAAHPRRRWIRNFSRNCSVSLGPRRTRRRTNSQNCFFHKRLLLWPSRMLLFMRISSHAGGGSRQPLLAPCILFFMFSKHWPSWLLFRNRVLASHLLHMPLLLLVVCGGWMDGFHIPCVRALGFCSLVLLCFACLLAAYRARRETAHHCSTLTQVVGSWAYFVSLLVRSVVGWFVC